MVYHLMGHDLTITFTQLDQDKPEVVVSLGRETRTFQLEGFINFWSDMVKVGRQAMDARLELIGTADSAGKGRTPTFHRGEEKRPDKSAYLFGHKKVYVVSAFSTQPRTFRFEEFIDLWQYMIELAPKAADRHLAYMESSMRQTF